MTTFKLRDGRTFDARTKQITGGETEQPVEQELVPVQPAVLDVQPVKELRLEDLPVDPRQMSVVGAVLSFRLMGLPDRDICEALNCSHEQLNDIIDSEAFTFAKDAIVDSFVNSQKADARAIIGSNAIAAAQSIVTVMRTARKEENRLKAAESILNRVGVGGDQDNPMSGGLMIKILKDTAATEISINMKG